MIDTEDTEGGALPLVFAGHVDHGKSTLIGRLLYDTGAIPESRLAEARAASVGSRAGPGEVEFAFLLDHLEEERRQGITIDSAQAFFHTRRREYIIIDAPGHREFLRNMLTGSTQAEAAVLLVDASEGPREQTRRHACLLALLGIRQVVAAINKMDLLDYAEGRFRPVAEGVRALFAQVGVEAAALVPMAARHGENVVRRSDLMGWYRGPTFLEALDTLRPRPLPVEQDLRLPVQDLYFVAGDRVAVGRVEAGRVSAGQALRVVPGGRELRVERLVALGTSPTSAQAGECVGLVLAGGEPPARGDLLHDGEAPRVTDRLEATIFWLGPRPVGLGERLGLRLATQETGCAIRRIRGRRDSASLDPLPLAEGRLLETEVAEVELALERPVAVEPFHRLPELGRFVLEAGGEVAGGGIVAGTGGGNGGGVLAPPEGGHRGGAVEATPRE